MASVIDGKIIFNYRLGDAQAADYYRPINLVTIEEYGETGTKRDTAIAVAALAALRRDIEVELDHSPDGAHASKRRADEITQIYEQLSARNSIHAESVYSGPAQTLANRTAVQALLEREHTGSRVIVCSTCLAEASTFLISSVAALHDAHVAGNNAAVYRSFHADGSTRCDRRSDGSGQYLPMRKRKRNWRRYMPRGPDWDQIVKRLSEERIDEELQLHGCRRDTPEARRPPSAPVAVNSAPCTRRSFTGRRRRTGILPPLPARYAKNAESWHSISEDGSLLIAVVYSDGSRGLSGRLVRP